MIIPTSKPSQETSSDTPRVVQKQLLMPRDRAYRDAIGISVPTIWRWTRAGKLSPPDAVINGRKYSLASTINSDIERLVQDAGH